MTLSAISYSRGGTIDEVAPSHEQKGFMRQLP